MSFAAACLVVSPANSLEAQEPALRVTMSPGVQEWREVWRLDVSRGASAELVWADSTLIVASLDRNVHIVAPRARPTVIWKENFKGGFEATIWRKHSRVRAWSRSIDGPRRFFGPRTRETWSLRQS
jgi:hypothetical protein